MDILKNFTYKRANSVTTIYGDKVQLTIPAIREYLLSKKEIVKEIGIDKIYSDEYISGLISKLLTKFNKKKEIKELGELQDFKPVNYIAGDGNNSYQIVNFKTNECLGDLFTYKSWYNAVGKDIAEELTSTAPLATFTYAPDKIERAWRGNLFSRTNKISSLNGIIFNTYTPPKWRLEESKAYVSEIYRKFFTHLFPDNRVRSYVFDMLYHILTDKLQVYLVLNGGTGVGKGIFTEHIVKSLVGKENFQIAPQGWDVSQFNSWLENKQVILLDEIKVDISNSKESNVNRLKRMIANDISIEKKGKDVTSPKKSYASFFITSNNGLLNFRLEKDNRRFSVLDITNKKVKEVFTKEEIEYLVNPDNSDIAGLGNYILNRTPKYNSDYVFKGDQYWYYHFNSLKQYEQTIVHLCTEHDENMFLVEELPILHEEYHTQTGKSVITNWRIREDYIEKFLNDYRGKDNVQIGELVRINNKLYLKSLVNKDPEDLL